MLCINKIAFQTYRYNRGHRYRRAEAERDGERYSLHTQLAGQSGEVVAQPGAEYLDDGWQVSLPLAPTVHDGLGADGRVLAGQQDGGAVLVDDLHVHGLWEFGLVRGDLSDDVVVVEWTGGDVLEGGLEKVWKLLG